MFTKTVQHIEEIELIILSQSTSNVNNTINLKQSS